MKTYDLFIESDKWSTKWKKYFDVYDHIFERFKKKKITFVEVGILDGGSLEIWKKYLNPNNRLRRENGASNFDLHYSYLKDGNPPPKNRLI